MADSLRKLRSPMVLAAFTGWNDAGDVASSVLAHVDASYQSELLFELDSDEYYDYQDSRPVVTKLDSGGIQLSWPSITFRLVHLPNRDLVLISGPEPNYRWKQLLGEIVPAIRTANPRLVILMGAMLSDCTHTRPVPITGSSYEPGLAESYGIPPSDYEGPTGIVGALAESCWRAGLDTVSLWASVPHYVSNQPNPKATLALLHRIEDLIEYQLDPGELPELAVEWENRVSEVIGQDPEATSYVRGLEAQQDEEDSAVDGDELAAELQRFLRQHNRSQ